MIKIFATIGLVGFLGGCTRGPGGLASVTLKLSKESTRSVYAAGDLPVDLATMCYAVNVKGLKIPTSKNACDIERGVFAGSVEPNGTLSVTLEGNSGYDFEIYGLRRNLVTDKCPTDLGKNWGFPLERVYYLGAALNVSVKPPTSDVQVTVTAPTVGQHLITTLKLGASCAIKGSSGILGYLGPGAATLVGNHFQVHGVVDAPLRGQALVGSRFQIVGFKLTP